MKINNVLNKLKGCKSSQINNALAKKNVATFNLVYKALFKEILKKFKKNTCAIFKNGS